MRKIIEFYNGLNTLELVIICIFIALFVFLIILSIILVRKNKLLVNRILELEEANKIDEDEQLIEQYYPIIESSDLEENITEIQDNKELIEEANTEQVENNNVEVYKTNILNDIPKQTSPISLAPESDNDKESYLESISKDLEQHKEIEPIELTESEQKQEDDAIISYQELLGSQDKLYNISDEEEDSPFIEELKSFRRSL